MRIKLPIEYLEILFLKTSEKGINLDKLASLLGVSRRAISDWKTGRITLPEVAFRDLIEIAGLKSDDLDFKILPEFWHIRAAAKKGARARMKLYGNVGTPEGRKKGGLASIATHKKNNTAFNNIKFIKKPQKSEKLAELLGILFGDGHLSKYQASVTTNAETDKEHAIFVQKLIKKLFHDDPVIKVRSDERAITVVLSSKVAAEYLCKFGMPMGNKIEANLSVPSWITKNDTYSAAFLRGLFDTDGCIYLDSHKIKSKIYSHLGWTITSYVPQLRKDIVNMLRKIGFSPTNRDSQTSVFLRRQKEVERYFSQIKTHNPKHLARYNNFTGRVPKWS